MKSTPRRALRDLAEGFVMIPAVPAVQGSVGGAPGFIAHGAHILFTVPPHVFPAPISQHHGSCILQRQVQLLRSGPRHCASCSVAAAFRPPQRAHCRPGLSGASTPAGRCSWQLWRSSPARKRHSREPVRRKCRHHSSTRRHAHPSRKGKACTDCTSDCCNDSSKADDEQWEAQVHISATCARTF